ncbi:MAG: aminodeoxychorismate/anthranilate synthase component II [Turicibacter sp.]|nr:aminodeoxychorismate/anthranilate synthase component II [Turicibacter sp.]
MILLIDNYDSFTYNLAQYLGEMGQTLVIKRNDAINLEEIEALAPGCIVLSPGPKTPNDAGILMDVLEHFSGKIPIFGVCLGHQAIGQAFGGKVVRAKEPMHGKVSQITHDKLGVYKGLPSPMPVTRYHSLVVERESLPDCLEITSETGDGIIMGIRHKTLPVEGVQYHPESIMTRFGKEILRNFLEAHGL